ncbi:MAG: hypothetical protein V3S81_03865 [Anaerolineales bacterium]
MKSKLFHCFQFGIAESSIHSAPPPPLSLPPPTHTARTPARLSGGRWPRAFGKLTATSPATSTRGGTRGGTPGLALVQLLVGGDGGGGQFLVQRQAN